jgi:hypothetical protein
MNDTFFQELLKNLLSGNISLGRFVVVFLILFICFALYTLIFRFEKIKEIILFFKELPARRKDKRIKKLVENRKETEKLFQEAIFTKSIEQNEKIQMILENTLRTYKADRVYIFQYHNTGYYKTGLSQLKASNTFELCATNIEHEKKNLQSIPISMFALWNYRIRDHKSLFFPDLKTMKDEDRGMYETCRAQNVKSIFNVGLYTKEGFPIGFFGVEYCTTQTDLTFDQRCKLSEIATDISGLLT